jgi:hypothetical protein
VICGAIIDYQHFDAIMMLFADALKRRSDKFFAVMNRHDN